MSHDALVRVIRELGAFDRYPEGRLPGNTRQRMVGTGSPDQPLLEDLAAVLSIPDSEELRPAVEAAAESLLCRGAVAQEILTHKALMASDVMTLRVVALLESRGAFKRGAYLRKRLKDVGTR